MAVEDEALPNIVQGSYQRLSEDDKAIVDSIILTRTIEEAANAEVLGAQASDIEITSKLMLDTFLNNQTTTDYRAMTRIGEAGLEISRELIANNPELIASIRRVHQEQQSTEDDLCNFTNIVNSLIAIDGDQFNVQTDLPNASDGQRQR